MRFFGDGLLPPVGEGLHVAVDPVACHRRTAALLELDAPTDRRGGDGDVGVPLGLDVADHGTEVALSVARFSTLIVPFT
jgi:hypothetical protein